MTKEEKINKINSLKQKAEQLKKESDYYNALQLALKLILNGSYGAFATQYFILFNQHVAGTITAQGRDLTKTMNAVNEKYWYEQWHLDYELHSKLGIKNVTPISKNDGEEVSIYADRILIMHNGEIISDNQKGITVDEILSRIFLYSKSQKMKGNVENAS